MLQTYFATITLSIQPVERTALDILVLALESLESVLSFSSEYVQPRDMGPGRCDLLEGGGEGVEGGEGGAKISTDGSLTLGQEIWELRTQPVHLLHPFQ